MQLAATTEFLLAVDQHLTSLDEEFGLPTCPNGTGELEKLIQADGLLSTLGWVLGLIGRTA